jgi:hypothetical protein
MLSGILASSGISQQNQQASLIQSKGNKMSKKEIVGTF